MAKETYLHPSHDWREEEEDGTNGTFRYELCFDCLACSCCAATAGNQLCPGPVELDGMESNDK